MGKIWQLFRGLGRTIRDHKGYFLAPILIIVVLLVLLVIFIGPSATVSIIYSGF